MHGQQGKGTSPSCRWKHITQCLSGENVGDVNLWGHEGPPSLAERRKQIDELKIKKTAFLPR